jgi:hypothetical protein
MHKASTNSDPGPELSVFINVNVAASPETAPKRANTKPMPNLNQPRPKGIILSVGAYPGTGGLPNRHALWRAALSGALLARGVSWRVVVAKGCSSFFRTGVSPLWRENDGPRVPVSRFVPRDAARSWQRDERHLARRLFRVNPGSFEEDTPLDCVCCRAEAGLAGFLRATRSVQGIPSNHHPIPGEPHALRASAARSRISRSFIVPLASNSLRPIQNANRPVTATVRSRYVSPK